MAKVLFTAVVADMRNKLNGTVFSKNRYGAYTRTKVTPVNPQTTAQQNQRNNLATNSAAWRGLTENERQSWIDGAINFPISDIFGNSKVLSGQALYVRVNNNLTITGTGTLGSCPAPVAIPALDISDLDADTIADTLTITATTPVPTGFSMVIFATPNVTPGKTFVKNQFRLVKVLPETTAGPFDIGTEWEALFGDMVLDQKVFVKAFYISSLSGQAGIPVQAMAIVHI